MKKDECIWYSYRHKRPEYGRAFIAYGKIWKRDIFGVLRDLETGKSYPEEEIRSGHWCYIPKFSFDERDMGGC